MRISLNAQYNNNIVKSFAPPASFGILNNTPALSPKNTVLQDQLHFMGINNKVSALNKKSEDPYSFENFEKARKDAGIYSQEDLEKEIKPENLLGKGSHSKVYKFSDPKLDKWVIKVEQDCMLRLANTEQNEFKGINVGQEITNSWKIFSILKKIEGEPHSVKNWSDRAAEHDFTVTKSEAKDFLSSLEKIADFPQSTFDDYAKQLKILSDKGFKMDSINPNNLLIDYDNKKISIIDFFRASDDSIKNSGLDLINSLLDFSCFKSYNRTLHNDGHNSLFQACKQIIDKCNKAAQKNDIPLDTQYYTKYLEWVDYMYDIEHYYEKSHMGRYDYISNVLFANLHNIQ